MTFSGSFDQHKLLILVKQELAKKDLRLNEKKIHIISRKSRQIVTGIVVNKKMQVNIDYRKSIRQEVYYIKKYGLVSHLNHIGIKDKYKYLNSLSGRISFVLQVDNTNKEFIEYKQYIFKIKSGK